MTPRRLGDGRHGCQKDQEEILPSTSKGGDGEREEIALLPLDACNVM